jgi:hypothetical protein
MRVSFPLLALGLYGCAGAAGPSGGPQHVAPPSTSGPVEGEAVGSGEGSPEHEPEVVQTGRSYGLSFDAARGRYQKKGTRCGGADAPDAVIGKPDRKNEMQQGREKVVTYGFRFHQATLVIRCRNDHVETTRVISGK